MQVCLINPLYGKVVSKSPPLGLAYIAALLLKNKHKVIIVDRNLLLFKKRLNIEKVDQEMIKTIIDFRPDIIGITATTLQIYDAYQVASIIKKFYRNKEHKILIGGFHPTAEPELTLKESKDIDIVVRGEGEFTMLELCDSLSLENIAGLTLRAEDKFISTPSRKNCENLDLLPLPARNLLDMSFYLQPSNIVMPNLYIKATTLITSRGCLWRCKFCASNLIHLPVRFHSIEYVLDEINSLVKNYSHLKAVSFVDSMFLANHERVVKICEKFLKNNLQKRIKWGANVRSDFIDRDILKLMKKAGCIYLTYGFESNSQRMLDLMGKKTTIEENINAVKITNEVGILVNSDMILGFPEEREEDILATIDFLKSSKIFNTGINTLLPLPGSYYYKEFLEKGIISYSNNLWREISALPEKDEEVKVYSSIPRDKFIKLYREAYKIANSNNIKNFIRINWHQAPLLSIKKIIVLILLKNFILYSFSYFLYQGVKKILFSLIKEKEEIRYK